MFEDIGRYPQHTLKIMNMVTHGQQAKLVIYNRSILVFTFRCIDILLPVGVGVVVVVVFVVFGVVVGSTTMRKILRQITQHSSKVMTENKIEMASHEFREIKQMFEFIKKKSESIDNVIL